MKRFLTSLLCVAFLASLLAGVSFAASGMDNFKKTNSYQSGRFSDVAGGAWYESGVAAAYNFSLVKGVSEKSFGTGTNMTLAEAVTLAARLHSIYHRGSADFSSTEPWYQGYVDYAVENNIMSARRFENLALNATRMQFAELMAAALPDSALGQINSIAVGEIPDVSTETIAYDAVHKLYRAGILTGKTDAGHFKPAEPILREEVATLVARMADPSLRKSFTIKPGEGTDPETGDTDISESIRLASQASLEAAVSCSAAQLLLEPPASPYGAIHLARAKELTVTMAMHTKNATAAAKDKPELEAVYEALETAQLGALEANRLVSVLSINGTTATEWAAAVKMLEGCTAALSRAADALG